MKETRDSGSGLEQGVLSAIRTLFERGDLNPTAKTVDLLPTRIAEVLTEDEDADEKDDGNKGMVRRVGRVLTALHVGSKGKIPGGRGRKYAAPVKRLLELFSAYGVEPNVPDVPSPAVKREKGNSVMSTEGPPVDVSENAKERMETNPGTFGTLRFGDKGDDEDGDPIRREDHDMTPEHAIRAVRDLGLRIDVEGTRLAIDGPEDVLARIPTEVLDALRAHKPEAVVIVRRMNERGPVLFTLRCVVCDVTFPETAPRRSWLPSTDGGSWPRCPVCTDRGRNPR